MIAKLNTEHTHTFVFLRQNRVYAGKAKNMMLPTTDYVYELYDTFYCQGCLEYHNVLITSYHEFTNIPYEETEG
jgi:hypothetical protein